MVAAEGHGRDMRAKGLVAERNVDTDDVGHVVVIAYPRQLLAQVAVVGLVHEHGVRAYPVGLFVGAHEIHDMAQHGHSPLQDRPTCPGFSVWGSAPLSHVFATPVPRTR